MADYHDGAQDGYKVGFNTALDAVIEMIRDDFPDPNPLSTIFSSYIGDDIIENIENMRKG